MKTVAKLSGSGVYPNNPFSNNDTLFGDDILQVYDDGANYIAIEKTDAFTASLPAAVTSAPKYMPSEVNYDTAGRSRNAITAIKSTPVTITRNMLGMNVGYNYQTFDFAKAGFIRLMDCGTQWKHIEQVAGGRDAEAVARMDDIVARAVAAGCEIIYVVNDTPPVRSRYPTNAHPNYWLPGDAGTPGTVDFTSLTAFINWLLGRYGNKITYIEGWNEPNLTNSYADSNGAAGIKDYTNAIATAVSTWNAANSGTVKVIGPTCTGYSGISTDTVSVSSLATTGAYANTPALGYHIYRGGGDTSKSVGFSVPKHLIWPINAQLTTSGISAKDLFITEFGVSDLKRVADAKWFMRHILYWIGRGADKVSPYAWDNAGIGDMRVNNVQDAWYEAYDSLVGKTIDYINELPSGELAVSIGGVKQFI